MGKKGHGWFSAIKKVFTSSSKDKHPPPTTTTTTTTNNNNEGDKVSSKQKKGGGIGRLKSRSLFIPPFSREPSSIEKILGEIDQQNIFIAHPPPPLQQTQLQPSSSYSGRPVSPTPPPPPQKSEVQPSSTSARPVSPPQQPQAQPSSSTSASPVSPPQQSQAQPPSSTSASLVSPPQQSQAQPSSSTSASPVSPPPQPQAQPSSSTSARHVSSTPPPQQSQAQPSSSYSERPLSPPQQSQAQLSSSSAKPVSPPPQVISSAKSGIKTPPPPPQVISPAKSGIKTPVPPPQVISPAKSGIKTPTLVASYAPPHPPRFVHSQTQISRRPKPTLQQQHLSAIRIQAAYRGHMVRRNIKGLTSLVRLQGVIRGQNVKRQTVNAMKQMQLLVRVQTQIQSRRIQTLENQALKRQANNNNDKGSETSLSTQRTEMGDGHWDYSSITKEERDARSRKKVEALIRRERTLAYTSSHQVRKGTPTSAQNSLMDIRTGEYPWWWNWLDRQLPNSNTPQPSKNLLATTPSRSRTPPDDKRTPKQLDRPDSPSTPMSSRSMAPLSRSRTPPSRMMKYSRASRGGGSPFSMKDDDSLMSCPQFSSVPHYMSPTVSAKAKSRPTTSSNSKDRATPGTPGSETSKRRFSFPFTPNSNRWKKSPASVGGMSIDSSISVSSSVGRKPFNRFV